MKRKYNYFYRTVNKVNNKFYYGIHKTDDLDDGYIGSGVRLKYAIYKYGFENFEREILRFFDTYEEALNFESEIVNEELINNSQCYNLVLGGGSGTNPWASNKESHNKNKACFVNENGQRFYLTSKEANMNNLSFLLKDRKVYSDNINNFYFLYENDEKIKKLNLKKMGTFSNKKHSKETKQKIGEKNSIRQSGTGNSQYGTCLIYNISLQKTKRIKKKELEEWLTKGWIKGAKYKW